MTILKKLTEKLCEVDEIDNDLDSEDELLVCNRDWSAWRYGTMEEDDFEYKKKDIQLHHLLWYCEEIGLPMSINCQGGFTSDFEGPQIDTTKDLSNQSEEVLEKIYNFITQ